MKNRNLGNEEFGLEKVLRKVTLVQLVQTTN